MSVLFQHVVSPSLSSCLLHWLGSQFYLWCLCVMLIKLKRSCICKYFCMPFKRRTNENTAIAFKHGLLWILKFCIYSSSAPGNRCCGSYLWLPTVITFPIWDWFEHCRLVSLWDFSDSFLCPLFEVFILQGNRTVRRQKSKMPGSYLGKRKASISLKKNNKKNHWQMFLCLHKLIKK